MSTQIPLQTIARTAVGKARDHNEDSVLATSIKQRTILAVADGMGGHRAGDVASKAALEQFEETVRELLQDGSDDRTALRAAVTAANAHLQDLIDEQPEYNGMGTTLVATLIRSVSAVHDENGSVGEGLKALYVNVGDSRGYHVTGSACEQVTVDHSLVQELVEQGRITPEEAETHPQRNVVSQALGTDRAVEPDFFERSVAGTILLCSDGLTDEVPESEIHRIVIEDIPLSERANKLIQEATERGGSDNIAVVLCERDSPD